ncbi:transcription initiation factor IID, 31kD subunit-domain-containing protein [Clohesyomyces aquaticus]|uniref:Transcription initiation factor IID, 31kD subunit-domain-containing protein n=1 Tax=Clohesyomyces aquaticus TaxID=1231657 RepID=A0A1Y1ZV52_9PLEO|nr:transcription initiation factor IID, 31kD subunit-domain-containing protein [Clohesyomyces aquaticus]
MASPAAADLPNGISTPPTTATGGANPSPPTASSTQPLTQSQNTTSQQTGASQSQQLSNGQTITPLNPAHPATSLQDAGTTKRPRDARLIHLLLANMGVHAYTERVPLQLLDFAYRYTSGVLSDAIAYEPPVHTSSTGKKGGANKDKDAEDGVSLNALRTAVGARVAQQFSAALPKEFMLEVASERNKIALPRVEREFGVRLPPERYCFTGVGWGVKESWESEGEEDEEEGMEVEGVGAGGPVADVMMGGMEEEDDVDENEFEDVMGLRGGDAEMADG